MAVSRMRNEKYAI